MNNVPTGVAGFVDRLQTMGRYSFSKSEAMQAAGESGSAVKLALWRLSRKGRVRLIRAGFYIIVPLEYASSGALPPDWFIDDLMAFIGRPYYVGLLSAAALHGASHQQPQEFQVMVPQPVRGIRTGNTSMRFFTKASMRSSAVVNVKTSTGYIRISDPAVTALDLVAYAGRVGGLDRVLTILQELREKLTPEMLLEASKKEERLSVVQRLGWLLEREADTRLTGGMATWIRRHTPRETPLDPSAPRTGRPRDARWNVIVNADVEGEL